ncbi:glycosyltransferase family 25 protein [Commensalibacter nepenthis]|uniref:Glycosyltransferase family 25 protein n=1 Tax=Commensalibacter nepenthis TaxID=3043872 RepID=A0ABT6Q8Q6_9PROT|nr:glycosyltransferase family 25 protein [Commensalibacter sp. TBRC 10068]MDI2113290.1 glycosyltransferase family 25 protein [Commensalibacter sp. TBRC 10068]
MLPIYLINLQHQKERLEQFKVNNPFLVEHVNIFKAYEGNRLARRQLIFDGLITEKNNYKPKALGILKSHVELWKIAAKSEHGITIMEDDIIVHPDFAKANQVLINNKEQYDLIAWGYNLDWPIRLQTAKGLPSSLISYLVQVGDPTKLNIINQIGSYENQIDKASYLSQSITPNFISTTMFAGLPCYSITPQCAQALLDQLPIDIYNIQYYGTITAINVEFGIDITLEHLYKGMNVVIASPFLAYSNNQKS